MPSGDNPAKKRALGAEPRQFKIERKGRQTNNRETTAKDKEQKRSYQTDHSNRTTVRAYALTMFYGENVHLGKMRYEPVVVVL